MEHAEMLPRDTAVQLIDADGTVVADETYAMPSIETLLAAYRGLVDGRRINDQAGALVRQGRLAVYPSSHGQEACQIGAALAIAAEDWLFPTYRDSVAVIARGVAPAEAMVLLKGDWHSGYDVRAHRVAPQATPLATQLLHAVGFAYAAKQRGEDTVVIALCGDGATSEGDFHEAMNFAAVFHVPVVFFVQNNEFAISVPLSRQTAAPSLAHKAIGYGMPGQRVDGNDVAAVLSVLGEAVDRARSGGGPTLVEAHTYRMQAHTNADDDTRYREREEVRAWVARDPLTRLRTHLTGVGALTAELEAEYAAGAERIAAAMREALNTDTDIDPEDLFRFVTETRSPQREEQWQMLRGEIERTRAADAEETAHATTGGSR
ncbi:pyruvate dehydrogenase (acetyl-transferring) E1 component subunit alpha [Microbacterium foliorum]|uniref:pyruvate dehydrogenase (acetyl-transferring) E1 component subunit alpha n=1 Tax=Microbacterium foliorum TaxID=104336 RepID=UPI001DFB5B40|nr:pyruvate dehydrogenase (acetyl-transferring) E1 component subunit alpha [Microbacterium foliorum]CAH0167032.1 3-methyl-2-oxobutanoate dehydrogenase subunit alpha [Microbacterium foliorum]CAH0195391.1 3-methyl-2-oxobutanoate dehydrogenase subunit alpha [Microbacterium foliorum]